MSVSITMARSLDLNNISAAELLKHQTVPVKGDETVRCSPLLKGGELLSYMDENARTLHEIFLRGMRVSNNGPCLGWRPGPDQPYSWIKYGEVLDRAQRFGSGLICEGVEPNPNQFIGIFSQNRVEWKIAEQACNSFSMVVVTLYDTLGPEAIRHIVNQCELKFIVVDKNSKAKTLLKEAQEGQFVLDMIVTMETPLDDVTSLAASTNTKVKLFSEIEENGKYNLKRFVPPKPEDLHTICYTSGTTGLPKGVMLTHANLVANHAGVYGMGKNRFLNLSDSDTYMSFLPLAHVFERLMAASMYFVGAKVGFFQGDIKLLADDIVALKPTAMAFVPRLINRIHDGIWKRASESRIKKTLLQAAVKSKLAKINKGITTSNTIWDKLVFVKARNSLGGNLKICITGAAPISLEVISFMRAALGLPFTEGYGQTEATAGISVSLPGDFKSGSVGSPALCNYVKLVDVPEKNYFAKDGKGEVCAKGSNIFKGYYKDEEKTKEALDEDGWLHTGDVGMWLPNGSLKIIDRKKHIFKLAQGEYIAPEKIEALLGLSVPVAQVFVHGESLKSTLVAIVVPDPETLMSWCSSKGVNEKYEDLLANDKVNKLILDDMCAVGKHKGLKAFELPKKIHLSGEMFSVQNELLTPTFKTKRPQVEKRYKNEIAEMYETLD